MATTIKIKNSATPSSTPSSLEQGEMALNVTDGKLFYGSGSGNNVKEFTGTSIDTGSFATTGSNVFISDQIITGSVEITGAITASGNISGSGTGSFAYLQLPGFEFDSSATTSELEVDHRLFDTGSSTLSSNGGSIGDIVKFGGTSTTTGHIYYLKQDGTWGNADASDTSASTGSLAVALGANSTTNGMLLRGMTNLSTDPSAGTGQPVFLSTTANQAQSSAPNGSGEVVRILGHQFGTDLIYFNPSNDYIVLS